MAPRYQPPTRVATKEVTFLTLVTAVDPNWSRGKFWDIEYQTAQRALYANPYQRGAYNRLDNTYPVGAAYGGLDALVEAALAPTVGNSVPGLYQGVATGGWA